MRCAGRVEHRVQPLEREREVGAALRRGDRVHLVDDHRVDGRERLAGRGGEHEEQRLGRRDQDLGRIARQRAALRLAGVARPHAHPDRRRGLAQALRGLRHADERGCAGCAPRRRRAPSAARRRARGCRCARPARGSAGGRSPTGTRPGSCPEPVGATTRACCPFAIAAHAPSCAGVGARKAPTNHSRVAAPNASRAEDMVGGFCPLPPTHRCERTKGHVLARKGGARDLNPPDPVPAGRGAGTRRVEKGHEQRAHPRSEPGMARRGGARLHPPAAPAALRRSGAGTGRRDGPGHRRSGC